MPVVFTRTLAAVGGACLMLVALWFGLFVMLSIPLEGPSALDACAEPCFGPPADYGAVAVGAAFAGVAAAICAALGAAGLALLFEAVGLPRPRRRRLLLAPAAAAGLVGLAVGVAQVIAAL